MMAQSYLSMASFSVQSSADYSDAFANVDRRIRNLRLWNATESIAIARWIRPPVEWYTIRIHQDPTLFRHTGTLGLIMHGFRAHVRAPVFSALPASP